MAAKRWRLAGLVPPLAVFLAVGVAVPAGAAVRAVGAAGSSPSPSAPVECVEEAGDAGAASVVAVECDREVEVLAERSEWASTFALPGGSMRLDMSMGLLHE